MELRNSLLMLVLSAGAVAMAQAPMTFVSGGSIQP